jgi:hypothetical protein
MPLERHEGGFYAQMAGRAAAVARDSGAITSDEYEQWMEILRERLGADEFLGGRLHLFCWGRKSR